MKQLLSIRQSDFLPVLLGLSVCLIIGCSNSSKNAKKYDDFVSGQKLIEASESAEAFSEFEGKEKSLEFKVEDIYRNNSDPNIKERKWSIRGRWSHGNTESDDELLVIADLDQCVLFQNEGANVYIWDKVTSQEKIVVRGKVLHAAKRCINMTGTSLLEADMATPKLTKQFFDKALKSDGPDGLADRLFTATGVLGDLQRESKTRISWPFTTEDGLKGKVVFDDDIAWQYAVSRGFKNLSDGQTVSLICSDVQVDEGGNLIWYHPSRFDDLK